MIPSNNNKRIWLIKQYGVACICHANTNASAAEGQLLQHTYGQSKIKGGKDIRDINLLKN
jgi:hypothetical protein